MSSDSPVYRTPYHPSVEGVLKYFEYGHLPENLRGPSQACYDLAHIMAANLQGAELTVGLRKLLEAKDCFVRARIDSVPADVSSPLSFHSL